MLAVVVKDRGVVRWKADGRRLVIPFPGPSASAFMDAVDDVLLARRSLNPADQAAVLVAHFPNATIREFGASTTPTTRSKAERRPSARDRRGRP